MGHKVYRLGIGEVEESLDLCYEAGEKRALFRWRKELGWDARQINWTDQTYVVRSDSARYTAPRACGYVGPRRYVLGYICKTLYP